MSTHSPGPVVSRQNRSYSRCGRHLLHRGFVDVTTSRRRAPIRSSPDMLRLLRVLVPMSESGAEDREGWMILECALNEASELIADWTTHER